MATSKKKKSSGTYDVEVNMTGVETFTKAAKGQHRANVKSMETTTTQGGDDAIKVVFAINSGKSKGCNVTETFSLSEKALWKFKAFLTAVGHPSDGKLKIKFGKIIDKEVGINVIHEDYQGTMRAKIADYLKPSDLDEDDEDEDDEDEDEDEEEDEEAPKKKAKAPAKKPAPAKKSSKKSKDEDEDEDEDDEDEDEEEDEDEPPAKPKKSAKKAAPAKGSKKQSAKSSKKKSKDEDEEEDEDDDWEDDEDDD